MPNYNKNKQAFGQAKAFISPHGKHSEQKTHREERRRLERMDKIRLTKEERLRKAYEDHIARAWSLCDAVPELKYVKLVDQSMLMLTYQHTEHIKKSGFEIGKQYAFISFENISTSMYYSAVNITVQLPGSLYPTIENKWMFQPCIIEEDVLEWIMKQEIYGEKSKIQSW